MLKEDIRKFINESNGIKAVDVVAKYACYMHDHCECNENVQDAIEELILENEIVVVEYAVPQYEYKLKTMFFPRGTKFYTSILKHVD